MFSKFVNKRSPAVQTHAVVSMRNKIYAANPSGESVYLGAVSRFDLSQSRNAEAVKGIGAGDVNIELVPNFSSDYTIRIETTMFYLRNLFQLFGYKSGTEGLVRALRHHKYPFDIKQELVFSEVADLEAKGDYVQKVQDGTASFNALITWYEGNWITSYSHAFSTDTSRVVENADVAVTDIVPGFKDIDPNDDTGNSVLGKVYSRVYYPAGPGGASSGTSADSATNAAKAAGGDAFSR